MATITSVAEFREYVKKMLGSPVICVEVTNDQIDCIIEDSIDEFRRYVYGEGAYESFLIFTVSGGVNTYSVSGLGIQDVIDFNYSTMGGINTLFTDMNFMWNYGLQDAVYGLMGGDGHNDQMALTSYEIGMQYVKEVENYFGKTFRVHYREGSETIHMTPTPETSGTGLMACYKKEDAQFLYNHVIIKKLVIARTRKIWGSNLGKFSVDMPGGGTVNGDSIYDRGNTDEEKVLEQMYAESQPIDPMMG